MKAMFGGWNLLESIDEKRRRVRAICEKCWYWWSDREGYIYKINKIADRKKRADTEHRSKQYLWDINSRPGNLLALEMSSRETRRMTAYVLVCMGGWIMAELEKGWSES